ncbi:MAG: DNA repair protein RadC [Eubacteriales bacterium]|nr:DNA repair protein RadC [Eubacteriales bacterium]
MDHQTIKTMPDAERPYEKCLDSGPSSLTDAELLAVILRTGTPGRTSVELAREILNRAEGTSGLFGLHYLTIPELCKIKGVGKVKAVQIQCITELSRRIAKAAAGEGHIFQNAEAIAGYYMEDFRYLLQEQVMLLMFDTKGMLLGERIISIGTVNQSCISPREIFLEALKHHAVYVILLHNHPSGDVTPSPEDSLVTERMRQAGEILGIELMDHIILGDRRYFSFREKGML